VLAELTLADESLAGVGRLLPRVSGTRQDSGSELATMSGVTRYGAAPSLVHSVFEVDNFGDASNDGMSGEDPLTAPL
jgi:hypothetical protein